MRIFGENLIDKVLKNIHHKKYDYLWKIVDMDIGDYNIRYCN